MWFYKQEAARRDEEEYLKNTQLSIDLSVSDPQKTKTQQWVDSVLDLNKDNSIFNDFATWIIIKGVVWGWDKISLINFDYKWSAWVIGVKSYTMWSQINDNSRASWGRHIMEQAQEIKLESPMPKTLIWLNGKKNAFLSRVLVTYEGRKDEKLA
jgi:hypothetical protein